MPDLNELREQIDETDRSIIDALKKRLHIADEIAEYKAGHGMPVLDRSREEEVLKKRREMAGDPSMEVDIDRLYRLLMGMSRARQEKRIKKANEKADREGGVVGYSGVPGAYADLAQNEYFKGKAETRNFSGFEEVFRAVERGEVEYGVLPIENSYAGSVAQVYDLLNQYDVSIVGEQFIPIENALLGVHGSSIEQIREVYSHDQPFMQCAEYLKNHPDWIQIPYYNTASSAQYVSECNDPSKAAIASEYAGEIYGLEVLQPSISASGENTTRFIVISAQAREVEPADKASISFVLEHRPGALAKILDSFADMDLNMVKIESRPLRDRNFEYRFFVDFSGEGIATGIRDALRKIQPYCLELRLLGVYRNGE